MAGETIITIIGNLTADPELRFTQTGVAVANFTVASTPRHFDRQSGEWRDGEALFLRSTAWREVAENIAGSLRKGMRVIVQGALQQRNYTDREGVNRTAYELEVHEIGPSLRYATAAVTKAARSAGNSPQAAPSAGSDQWATGGDSTWPTTQPGSYDYSDEVPF